MADKNFWTIHYLPSFNIALIYKISKFSFGHHCVHKSQAAKFINIWPSDTYQKIWNSHALYQRMWWESSDLLGGG